MAESLGKLWSRRRFGADASVFHCDERHHADRGAFIKWIVHGFANELVVCGSTFISLLNSHRHHWWHDYSHHHIQGQYL